MRRFLALALLLLLVLPACRAVPRPGQYLWQTNAHGDDIHVIEVATQAVVGRIVVGPEPHGIAAPRDMHVVFVAVENKAGPTGELLWIHPHTWAIQHRLAVGPAPNQIACTPDGRWVYVPCDDGHYWVVDALRRRVVKKIQTGGRPHNTTCSPDGQTMYLSPMGDPRRVTVVDIGSDHGVTGHIPFPGAVRPPALSADGERLYQQVDNLMGYCVADTRSRRVTTTVHHTVDPARADRETRCHGLAIRPDQREIWACDYKNKCVYVHDLSRPDMPQTHRIKLPGRVYWLCFTPDGALAYVAVRNKDDVCAIDTRTKQVVARISVGDTPKRNLVITLD